MAAVKRYRKEGGVSYTLGMTLTFELLLHASAAVYLQRVFIHPEQEHTDAYGRLLRICGEKGIPAEINQKPFQVLSQKENCFVIGEFRKFTSPLIQEENHIVLVNPSNAGNMGTILRSCVGFAVRNMAVVRPAVDLFDPKTVRASMGAVFHMNFCYYDSMEEYMEAFPEHKRYPFMLDADTVLPGTVFHEPYALIFGNEAAGLPEEYHSLGHTVLIPQTDKIDSLNLPVAVGIALYEAAGQKNRPKDGIIMRDQKI